MFSGGFTEIGFILFIAFLLFGPKKLPEIARMLGKGMGELRRASNELKFSLEEEIRNLDRNDEETSYSQEETYPYVESNAVTPELPEAEEETPTVKTNEYPESEEEAHEVETQSEGEFEPAPKYGYDHSESPLEEPESRS